MAKTNFTEGFKTRLGSITKIKSQNGEPVKMESGQTIINKKATEKNLKTLVEINNDSPKKTSKKETNDGTIGGLLQGPAHYDKSGKPLGGIKVIVDNNKEIEVEGKEFVVNKEASKKHWKELSKINQSAGNGVPINEPNQFDEDPAEYKQGGNVIDFNPNRVPSKMILNYAKKIKKSYPEVWKLGGNIFGNEAFENLKRVSERGYWLDSEKWMYIKWRSYVARHIHDFRIEGVIAMLKWVDKVEKGWPYMKALIEEEIQKKATKKMDDGGNIDLKNPNTKKLIEELEKYSTKTTSHIMTNSYGEKYVYHYWKLKYPSASNWLVKLFMKAAKENTGKDYNVNFSFDDFSFYYDRPEMKNRPNGTMQMKKLEVLNNFELGGSLSSKLEHSLNLLKSKISPDQQKLAPNGKPSNLTAEQYKLVRTPAFKAWFGDWENDPKNASKVVDENGEPMVVYRGDSSANKKGNVFKTGYNRMGYINKNRLPNQYFHYFVNKYDVAEEYAKDQVSDHNSQVEYSGKGKLWKTEVTPYFLNIRNYIDLTPSNPNFPSFEEFKETYRKAFSGDWFEGIVYRLPWDYGFELNGVQLNKILADKLGKDYLDNKPNWSHIPSWVIDRLNYENKTQNVYSFFIEYKDSNYISILLNRIYYKMLEKNIDGLVWLESTHWNDGFWANNEKYESGELKYDSKRWVEKPKVFAALESNQIKLADGTNTTFDGSNPDIRFDQGGYLTYKDKYNRKFEYKKGEPHDLKQISKDTGVSKRGLQQIFNKGIGAYKTNPKSVRPNVKSKEQWAMGRVYSAVMGGKASKIDAKELKMSHGGNNFDKVDTVTIDIPLMIRLLEHSREDIKSDAELHFVVENLLKLKNKEALTMDDYAFIADVKKKHLNNLK